MTETLNDIGTVLDFYGPDRFVEQPNLQDVWNYNIDEVNESDYDDYKVYKNDLADNNVFDYNYSILKFIYNEMTYIDSVLSGNNVTLGEKVTIDSSYSIRECCQGITGFYFTEIEATFDVVINLGEGFLYAEIYEYNEDDDSYQSYRVIYIEFDNQSVANDEFKAGRLDAPDIEGDSYEEFKNSPYIKFSLRTTFYRLIFNIEGSVNYESNPILQDINFRKALYYAINREEYSNEVRVPSHPTLGFLGPAYYSSESSIFSYRGPTIGQNKLADYFPDDYGYNPVKAKELFDLTYQNLVDTGIINNGDKVSVEFKYYGIESGYNPNMWFKDTIEAIFNEGEDQKLFELTLTSVSASALELAIENGDFEIVFGGWQGLQFVHHLC